MRPDALADIDAGANLLGFNFYPQESPPYREAEVAKIRRSFRKGSTRWAFSSMSRLLDVAVVCKSLKLDAAQLHGR